MTCIIGLEHNGAVYMGGDSIALNGWSKDIIAGRKIFRKGEFLFGCAGNPRQAQLLQYLLDIPNHPPGMGDEAYLVTVVEAVRLLFREKGYTEVENGRESGAGFLMGYRGKLYSVENSFQLCRSARGMYAMGAGDDFAMGALAVVYGAYFKYADIPSSFAESCLSQALEVAGQLSACVAGPYYVECLAPTP